MEPTPTRTVSKNIIAHIVFALVVVSVLVYVFTRDTSEPAPSESTTVATTPSSITTLASVTTSAEAAPTTSATVVTTSTVPQVEEESGPALNLPTATYIEALNGFEETLDGIVSDVTAVNQGWESRRDTGATYSQTESAFEAIIERTRALHNAMRDQEVPAVLATPYRGPEGLVSQMGGIVTLTEEVLARLRLPAPEDGTARRAAVANVNTAAALLISNLQSIVSDVNQNAEDLGLTATAADDTATTQPPQPLSGEAATYIVGLSGFKNVLANLAAGTTSASQDWDNKEETGVSYGTTMAVFEATIQQARAFQQQVGSFPVPAPVEGLGQGPIQHAARLPALAEAILAGLRIPAPDDGSARRTALAEFNQAVEDFHSSVDNLVSYIEENAAALGLAEGG